MQTARELKILGYESYLTKIEADLVDLQVQCRRDICEEGKTEKVGPAILDKVRREIPNLLAKYSIEREKVDELFCIGTLWEETEKCNAWWQAYNGVTKGVKE